MRCIGVNGRIPLDQNGHHLSDFLMYHESSPLRDCKYGASKLL